MVVVVTCSQSNYHDLWISFHNNPTTLEQIRMPKKAFDDVAQCHMNCDRSFKMNTVLIKTPAPGSKRVWVRRKAMFDMLVAHGEVCN